MTTIPSPEMPQIPTDRARLRELARIVGDVLREERRAADRSLVNEFAASEADFEGWINTANARESDE